MKKIIASVTFVQRFLTFDDHCLVRFSSLCQQHWRILHKGNWYLWLSKRRITWVERYSSTHRARPLPFVDLMQSATVQQQNWEHKAPFSGGMNLLQLKRYCSCTDTTTVTTKLYSTIDSFAAVFFMPKRKWNHQKIIKLWNRNRIMQNRINFRNK